MSVITSLCCTSSGESSCCWSTNWTGEFKKFGQSPTTNGNLFICIFLWIAFPLHMTEIHSAAYILEMGILISAEFWRCIYCWCHEYLFQCAQLWSFLQTVVSYLSDFVYKPTALLAIKDLCMSVCVHLQRCLLFLSVVRDWLLIIVSRDLAIMF